MILVASLTFCLLVGAVAGCLFEAVRSGGTVDLTRYCDALEADNEQLYELLYGRDVIPLNRHRGETG